MNFDVSLFVFANIEAPIQTHELPESSKRSLTISGNIVYVEF